MFIHFARYTNYKTNINLFLKITDKNLMAEMKETIVELRAENEQLVEETLAQRKRIIALENDVKELREALATVRSTRSDSDTESVASDISGVSAGGSLPAHYVRTGFLTKVAGVLYPIVTGPMGAMYTLRTDGRLHRLSAKQHRDMIPV